MESPLMGAKTILVHESQHRHESRINLYFILNDHFIQLNHNSDVQNSPFATKVTNIAKPLIIFELCATSTVMSANIYVLIVLRIAIKLNGMLLVTS